MREIHLAGYTESQDGVGARLLIDSHDSPVTVPVWQLYESALTGTGAVATLIEWDASIPRSASCSVRQQWQKTE